MDEPRNDANADDPRSSIAAFLEAARREGLLSDVDATALVAFYTRLVSAPLVELPTEADRTDAERLIRDLDVTRRRITGVGPDRPLLAGASRAIYDCLRREDKEALTRTMAEARRVLDGANQRLREADAKRVAQEREAAALPSEAVRTAAQGLVRRLAGRRQTVLEHQRPRDYQCDRAALPPDRRGPS